LGDDARTVASEPIPRTVQDNRRRLPTFDVPFDFDEEMAELIRKHYRVEPVLVSRSPHTHGFIALGRAIAERWVCNQLPRTARILDVGGSPTRHHRNHRDNIWSACPVLSPRDAGRAMSYPRTDGGAPINWCEEMGEVCQHGPFQVAIAIHSLYYLNAKQIYTIIERTTSKRLYAVVHSFPDISGSLIGGEAYWYRPNNTDVVFEVTNEPPYQHAHIDWIERGYLYVPDRNDIMIVAKRRDMFGDHHIYEIQITARHEMENAIATYRLALSTPDRNYPMLALPPMAYPTERGLVPIEFETIKLDRVLLFRGVAFVFGTVETSVPLSRHILGELSGFAATKNRDGTTYKELHTRARDAYSKRATHMPEMLRAEAALITAMLAMSQTVALETQLIAHGTRIWGDLWRVQADMVRSFAPTYNFGGLLFSLTLIGAGGLGVLALQTGFRGINDIRSRIPSLHAPPGLPAIIPGWRPNFPPSPTGALILGREISNYWLYAIFGAPFLEEKVKRFWGYYYSKWFGIERPYADAYSGLSFGLYESCERAGLFDVGLNPAHGRAAWITHLPVVFMHMAWAACPLPIGVFAHMLNNATACVIQVWQPELVAWLTEEFVERSRIAPILAELPTATLYANASPAAQLYFAGLVAQHGIGALRLMWFLWFDRCAPTTNEDIHYPPALYLPGETEVAPKKFSETTNPDESIFLVFQQPFRGRKPRLMLRTIGFDYLVPSYYLGTATTEEAAITQRLLIERPPPNLAAWAEAHALYDASEPRRLLEAPGPLVYRGRVAFERWLAKYQSARRRAAILAEVDAHDGGPLSKRDNRRAIFIKGEIRMEYVFDEHTLTWRKLGTPRSIISSSYIRLSRTGPFFYSMGLRMQEAWTGEACILYGACSCEVLGHWFTYWFFRLGPNVWFLMCDTVRQDANYSKPAIVGERRRWKRLGLQGKALSAVTQGERFTGLSMNGWMAKVEFRRASGDAQTSVGNTEENAEVTVFSCKTDERPMTIGEDTAAAVSGDDLSMLTDVEPDIKDFCRRSALLGFPVEATISQNLWDFEFCSKLMYPSADGFIPAPKLGRMITKFGWKIEKPFEDLRSVASVCLDDMWHVPFAREFLQTILRVLPVTKRRKVIPEDDYKMHVARRHETSPDVWPFLENRYGLTRADHLQFCELLTQVHTFPVVLRVAWAPRILRRDS
jgi:hypothetical protein